ncbi:hypothetical protein FISHEDRAFT_44824 [Fistulina hepatica ATCC 64428]|uniref:Origin recognition complex subunit 5 n=1 Tax=Fistulina hepatica ATCC 64428 TaxID=1128425 RepID=A0A0D7A9R0_9AGAR|nr:hypothetical protein FISHEDRAFT_44824 [Fistulina hepatica ATCC 64428]
MDFSAETQRLSSYDHLRDQLAFLLSSSGGPPFIFVHDPATLRTTAGVLTSTLSGLSHVLYSYSDAVSCFSSRILYVTVLNSLMKWSPSWDDGCSNWGEDRGDDSFDAFLHALRTIVRGKVKEGSVPRVVLAINRADRMSDFLPELIVPLTRLSELAQINITVIFLSQVRWKDMRPSLGASPDPFYIDVFTSSEEDLERYLTSLYSPAVTPYHPNLRSCYTGFASLVYQVCRAYITDPLELQYIIAARWPGYVQPLLDEHRRHVQGNEDINIAPPSEDMRMRLNKHFGTSISHALETLYPRLTHAGAWAAAHKPPPDLLHNLPTPASQAITPPSPLEDLPRMSMFILVAAFLASTNPPKSDLRMFGRGVDEKKHRRRITRVARKTGPTKVPQRLQGPMTFPLDRLVAILGALLEEYDADDRPLAPQYTIPGEYTDMEIRRVGIQTAIAHLATMRLLDRITPVDRLDGPPTLKCRLSYEDALVLARRLKVPLNDLLWDPV